MEDRAYRNAMKRRTELQAEIDEIDRFLVQWKRYAGTEQEHDATPGEAQLRTMGAAPRVTLNRTTRAQVLRKILVETGHPMTRGQIVAALNARGIDVGGTDAGKNIGTIMWRLRDQFMNIEGHGYWPKDLPYAPARYSPEGEDEPAKVEMTPT